MDFVNFLSRLKNFTRPSLWLPRQPGGEITKKLHAKVFPGVK
jgi:hypothetical protein